MALEEIAQAERCVSHVQAAPRGRRKLNAPMSFGILGPALPDFLTRYPEITLDVSYNDRFVDVIEEGYGVTLRIIPAPPDSTLIACRLTLIRFVVCAAPLYWERAGIPKTPQELIHHNCLIYILTSGNEWHSFPQSVQLKPDEIVVFSWIVYKSRKYRDRVTFTWVFKACSMVFCK